MLHGRRMETIALKPLEEKVIDTSNCPIAYTLTQIGGVWKSRLLWAIEFDINRFSLLLNKLTISRKSLSKELKELERNGMITRKSFPEVPPRVEYYLTKKGKSVFSVVRLMSDWGEENMP